MEDKSNVKEIHVASVGDNNYAQHLGVTFTSLLMNLSPGTKIHLYVLSTRLNTENKSKLETIASHFGARIEFIEMDGSPYAEFSTSGHLNRETYLRLAVPDVIPSYIDKVILLDSDIVVTGNIAEMWEMDLRGRAIGAVSDRGGAFRCKDLKIPEGVYFNAGIYVMDLFKWRKESIRSKVMDYLARNTKELIFHDQDALNAVLYDDWLELSAKWNVQPHMLQGRKGRDNVPSPAIIHYTGSCKPWHFEDTHPYKKEYYKYLKMTEWKSYKPELTLNRFIKRVAKQLLPYSAVSILKKARKSLLISKRLA
ncbi:glycosyltransferase family 8 protein [Cohnella suwonensis]|uniref:Glycosyltransferase family 8 protein n=1 Tax=Cohnella suwonensis TaxID=696072 RepID=A0ABW0M245_9BACL